MMMKSNIKKIIQPLLQQLLFFDSSSFEEVIVLTGMENWSSLELGGGGGVMGVVGESVGASHSFC
jgi:hypothetical protein